MNQENDSPESISETAKKFKIELEKSPEFSSYITINYDGPVLNLTEYQHTTGELVNFYHYQIIPMNPHINLLSSDIIVIVSKDRLIYSLLYYISKEVFNIKSASYQENTKRFLSFLEFLDSLQNKYMKFPISINSKKITDDLATVPTEAKSLESFGKQLISKAHHKSDLDPNNKKLFQKLMTSLSPFLSKALILRFHCYQNIFNAAVSQEDFVFHNEIDSFFNSFDKIDPYSFIETMIETCERFTWHFQLSGIKNSNIIIIFILLQRYIFDQIYSSNHYFFKQDFVNVDIIFPISRYTFQKLNLSLDFFNPNTKPRNTIRKILREDEFYKLAIDDLEQMQFYTSPFDICACVTYTIQDIKKGAEHYLKSSFDLNSNDLITIFMAVAIASDIPEFYALSNFVNAFVNNSKSTELIPVSNEMKHAKYVLFQATKQLFDISEKESKKFSKPA